MTDGIWVLALVLQIGQFESIVKPVQIYDDPQWGYYLCQLDKEKLAEELDLVMTCTRIGEA